MSPKKKIGRPPGVKNRPKIWTELPEGFEPYLLPRGVPVPAGALRVNVEHPLAPHTTLGEVLAAVRAPRVAPRPVRPFTHVLVTLNTPAGEKILRELEKHR